MKPALILILFAFFLMELPSFAASYTFDELDRLQTVTYSSGKKVTYSYDAAGNIVSTAMSIPNAAPVITEGTTVAVTMSKNSSPTLFSLTLHATDTNNDTLTWSIATTASHGIAATSGTGSSKWVAYAPTAGYIGTDSFVVNVADGNGGIANITVNVTVTQTYTVTYNGNGNTSGAVPTDANAYLSSGATVTVLGNTGNLAKTGYSFVGWNTLANGSGTSYAVAATFSLGTANVTLYAQWSVLPTYTVSYIGNGSTGGAVPNDSNLYLSGATVTVFGNTGNLTKTGYTFKGWNTAANGAGTPYAAASTFSMGSANVTLYAQWTVDDITGPTLTVSSLANSAITNNATLNVSGTVSDTNGVASLKINNTAVTITNGTFSHAVTLQTGSNTIITVATDTLGNSTTDTRTITLDQTAPSLTVSIPADNSKTAQATTSVSGTVNETSTVGITINSGTSQPAALTGNAFSSTVNLTSGINTIAITATDLAGNSSNAKRTIIYDDTKPTLAVTNPAQDITTDQNTTKLEGTVTDALSTVTITITADGQTYTPTITNGAFSQEITFTTAKQYSITVTATDEAGNSSAVQRNIIYKPAATAIKGDVNGDGKIDIFDALLTLQYGLNLIPHDATSDANYLANADVAPLDTATLKPKGDGKIDIMDALVILQRSVNLLSW